MPPLVRIGLPLGDRISVKAPFDTDEGSVEFMWIGVTESTSRGVVRGRLSNTPFHVKSLQLGAKVEVKETSIVDYV